VVPSRFALVTVVAALAGGSLAMAPRPVRAADAPAPAATSAPAAELPTGFQVVESDGRRVIADSQSLAFRTGQARRGPRTVSDFSADEAANIRRINETRGTYQSYLLATREDLPVRLFHEGFIITLPPPRKRAPAAATEDETAAAPAPPAQPAETAPAAKP